MELNVARPKAGVQIRQDGVALRARGGGGGGPSRPAIGPQETTLPRGHAGVRPAPCAVGTTRAAPLPVVVPATSTAAPAIVARELERAAVGRHPRDVGAAAAALRGQRDDARDAPGDAVAPLGPTNGAVARRGSAHGPLRSPSCPPPPLAALQGPQPRGEVFDPPPVFFSRSGIRPRKECKRSVSPAFTLEAKGRAGPRASRRSSLVGGGPPARMATGAPSSSGRPACAPVGRRTTRSATATT